MILNQRHNKTKLISDLKYGPKDSSLSIRENALMQDLFDTFVHAVYYSANKKDKFHTSFPITSHHIPFFKKKSPKSFLQAALIILEPFQWDMWLWLIIFILGMFAVIYIYEVPINKLKFWQLFNSIFPNNESELNLDSFSAKLIFVILGIFIGIFIVSLYETFLFARFVLKPKSKESITIKDVANMIESGELKLLITPDHNQSTFWINLELSKKSIIENDYKILSRALEKNEIKYVEDINKSAPLMETGKYISFAASKIQIIAPMLMYNVKPCTYDFFYLNFWDMLTILYNKNFSENLVEKIDENIVQKMAIIQQKIDKYDNYYERKILDVCPDEENQNIIDPLNLNSFAGIIIVFLFGSFLRF